MKKLNVKNIYFLSSMIFVFFICQSILFRSFVAGNEIVSIFSTLNLKINETVLIHKFFSLILGILFSGIILLNCYICGYLAERKFSFNLTHVSILALGIIVYSIYIFIVGSLFQIIDTYIFQILIMLPLLSISFLKSVQLSLKEFKVFLIDKFSDYNFFLIFLISIIPLLFSNSYPIDYDVLEYHLGAPKEFYKNGIISFLSHNVYANMPSLSSMLNLVFIVFNFGDFVKIFQTVFIIITSLLLYNDIKEKTISIICIILFLLSPEVILGSYSARNEPMLMFFAYISLRFFIITNKNISVFFLGLMGGALFCLKYSSIVLMIPVIIFFIVQNSIKNYSINFIKFFSGVLTVCLPWLIRNYIASNNPLYPFLPSFFSVFFELKSHPDLMFNSLHMSHSFTFNEFLNLITSQFQKFDSLNIWIIFLPFVFIVRKTHLNKIALVIVLSFLLWFFFTHRIERFLMPFLPFKILLISYVLNYLNGWKRSILLAGCIIQIIFNVIVIQYSIFTSPILPLYFGQITKNEFIAKYDESFNFINKCLNKDLFEEKILMIGEARTYYYMQNILYNTPYMKPIFLNYYNINGFDVEKLKKDNIKYIFINKSEFNRVIKKYLHYKIITFDEIKSALTSIGNRVYEDERKNFFMFEVF